MAGPQHRTPEYRAAYKALRQANQQRDLECVQPVCVMNTRLIPRGTPIDVAHNNAGTVILGPAHRRCNRADGGRRRTRSSRTIAKRWDL